MTTARVVLNRAMTEDELLTAILLAAKLYNWRAHHVRRSDLALQQGQAGFPDVVLARAGQVMFLELKREGKLPTPDQLAWLDVLPDAHVVYPSDLSAVLEWLK